MLGLKLRRCPVPWAGEVHYKKCSWMANLERSGNMWWLSWGEIWIPHTKLQNEEPIKIQDLGSCYEGRHSLEANTTLTTPLGGKNCSGGQVVLCSENQFRWNSSVQGQLCCKGLLGDFFFNWKYDISMYLNAAGSRMWLDMHQDVKAAYLHAPIDWVWYRWNTILQTEVGPV